MGGHPKSRSLDHDVRLDLPSIGRPFNGGRCVVRVALWRAGISPLHKGIDIVLRERAVVREYAVLRVGEPGRHLATLDPRFDRARPWPGALVREHRERSNLVRPMARLT